MLKSNQYLVTVYNDEDDTDEESQIITIYDNVNRPNNPDDDEIIDEYVHENYGFKEYNSKIITGLNNVVIK
jgi:hypothetical protein